MGILLLLGGAIGIGVLAQVWKGRTGIGWGLGMVVVGAIVWFVIVALLAQGEASGDPATLALLKEPHATTARDLLVTLFTVAVMAVLVATTPNLKQRRRDSLAQQEHD